MQLALSPDCGSVIAGHVPRDIKSRFSYHGSDWLRGVFRVALLVPDKAEDHLAGIAGHYQMDAGMIRFTPHFPFEPGLPHVAFFDSPWAASPSGSRQILKFIPKLPATVPQAKVEGIFPSQDVLPQNLLRFYVHFSQPMLRGHAEAEIKILGEDDEPLTDVLYRPPIELWDRSMRCLTVLLDPGRLKRYVGPNKVLGPPLQAGGKYTFVVGSGMRNVHGQLLLSPVSKSFTTTKPERSRIHPKRWCIIPPTAGTMEPLTIVLDKPIDRPSLMSAIKVETGQGTPISGSIGIANNEHVWHFTPCTSWPAESICVRIDPGLEDVCGNTLIGPFEQPLRRTTSRMQQNLELLLTVHPNSSVSRG